MQMQNENEEGFHFTYSAKEQEELEKIREKYQPREEDKMAKLRRMDAGVTKKASAVSLVVGLFGALIMGTGMSLFMTDLGENLGISGMAGMGIGIGIGIVGMILIGIACPLYYKIVKRERKKIAPEILRITEELMR